MPSRIVIAGDDRESVDPLAECLADFGCEMSVAVGEPDTLAKVEAFRPDLLLLDAASGAEVCKRLKAKPEAAGVRVLIVLALNDVGDIERAVAAGCDDFLSKPVHKQELLNRVQTMLRLKK